LPKIKIDFPIDYVDSWRQVVENFEQVDQRLHQLASAKDCTGRL